jgi:hypothetical protein
MILTRRTAIGLIFLILAGGLLAISLCNYLYYSPREFDPVPWRTATLRQRCQMTGDLCRKGILIGKTRQEAIDLLGEPDGEDDRSMRYDFIRSSLGGDLFNLPFSGWREWLKLELDSAGQRVVTVEMQD